MRQPSDYRYDSSDPFGSTAGRRYPHTGSDYFAPTGSPVYAIANGVINHVGETSYNGKTVMQSIDGHGLNAAYLHLSNNGVVGDGQRVSEGQIIGYSGNSGSNSLGPHLHLTISDGAAYDGLGNKIDPYAFIASNGGSASGGALAVDGEFGPATKRALQAAIGTTPDGVWGPASIRALQGFLGVAQDGDFGPISTRALQGFLGVAQDGDWGRQTTRAIQERLNAGTFTKPAPAPVPAPAPAPAEPTPVAPETPATPTEEVKPTPTKKPTRKPAKKPVKEQQVPEKTYAVTAEQWKLIEEKQAALEAKASGTEDDLSQYDLVSVHFWNYSGERIIKTFAMTFASMLSTTGAVVVTNPSTANVFSEIGWWYILSVSGVSALTSLLVALSSFKNITTLKKKK